MATAIGIQPQYRSYSGVNRAALRLGLALITWSRRRPVTIDHEEHQRQLERQKAMEFRDSALRQYYGVIR
jgi:hypothetical protein